MLDQILNAITHNPWVLALGTVAFFAIKGILWLLIPFLVIRYRRLAFRNSKTEDLAREAHAPQSVPSFAQETKRAA
jgi:hypothetical protein